MNTFMQLQTVTKKLSEMRAFETISSNGVSSYGITKHVISKCNLKGRI